MSRSGNSIHSTCSIFILTYNEEKNIGRCLESIHGWTDDIVIVDSGSTDGTLDICRRYGARIFQHEFKNHALQCNWALENVDFKHEWILRLDSDEVVPRSLRSELADMIPALPVDVTGILRWNGMGGDISSSFPLRR